MPSLSVAAALRAYYFIAFGAVGLYLPYFPAWLRARGYYGWQMSLIMALLPFCQLLSPTLVGILADRLGLRGGMMTVCAGMSALGVSVLTFFAQTMDTLPLSVTLACAFVFAALRSPVVGLADVMAMETSSDYGRMRLWGSLGFMVSSLLGGRFLDPEHPTLLPLVVSALLWALAAASLLLPQNAHLPPRPAAKDAHALLQQPSFRRLLLTMTLIFCSFSAYDLCVTLRLYELGAAGSTVGRFWAIATCSEVILLFWARRILQSIGPGKLLCASCLVSAARWILIADITSISSLVWLQPLHAVSFGLMWASAIGVLKREVGVRGTATAQGLYGSAIAVGGTIGFLSWGPVYEIWGSERVFAVSAAIMTAAALSAVTLIRLPREDAAQGLN